MLGVAANCKVDFFVTRDFLAELVKEPPISWLMQIGYNTTNCFTLNYLSISKEKKKIIAKPGLLKIETDLRMLSSRVTSDPL